MAGLGDLAGGEFKSLASGVSADGSVVVGKSSSASSGPPSDAEYFGYELVEAFRWTADEGMVGLGDLGGYDSLSAAYAVSADGSVVAGEGASASSAYEAFRWTADGGMVGLGVLPEGDPSSSARAVSADGSVVVGFSQLDDGPPWTRAFLWDADHGMRRLQDVLVTDYGLDLSGWELGSATGISADGRTIVGCGVNPDGDDEAWIAVLPRPVAIDVRPGSEDNFVHPAGRGWVPVALLGSETFDVAEVEASALAFGPGGAAPAVWLGVHARDVDDDGFTDLLAFYRTLETGIAFGDTEACLRGETLAGEPFEGCDSIATLPGCGNGFEAALVLPPLAWLRTRLRRRRA